jgi:hypothetical protein
VKQGRLRSVCGRGRAVHNVEASPWRDDQEINQTHVAIVGGKGAHLGELSRIEGGRVPAGTRIVRLGWGVRTSVGSVTS